MDDRDKLIMAATIVAIRTAKLPPTDFYNMATPRVMAEIAAGLAIADKIGRMADRLHQQAVVAERANAERDARLAAAAEPNLPKSEPWPISEPSIISEPSRAGYQRFLPQRPYACYPDTGQPHPVRFLALLLTLLLAAAPVRAYPAQAQPGTRAHRSHYLAADGSWVRRPREPNDLQTPGIH